MAPMAVRRSIRPEASAPDLSFGVVIKSFLLARRLIRAGFPPKYKSSESGGGHDVDGAVLIQIHRKHIGTGAGVIVDQLGNEFRAAGGFRIAHCAIPVNHSRTVGVGIEIVVAVRPET